MTVRCDVVHTRRHSSVVEYARCYRGLVAMYPSMQQACRAALGSVGHYVRGHQDQQKHIASTYFCLRLGMFLLAFLTPFIIVGWGLYWGGTWLSSISAYYFGFEPATTTQWVYSTYPTRVFFVGILFALGFSLWAYKGFTRRENILLNIAGLCAVLVAIFPMWPESHYIAFSRTVHFTSAVILFVCMALVANLCSTATLQAIEDKRIRANYLLTYHVIGGLMWLFPVIGILGALFLDALDNRIFWIEVAGIWIFAAFWGLKTYELRSMEVDMKAVKGELSLGDAVQVSAPPAEAGLSTARS
jgi:hypothetical protein